MDCQLSTPNGSSCHASEAISFQCARIPPPSALSAGPGVTELQNSMIDMSLQPSAASRQAYAAAPRQTYAAAPLPTSAALPAAIRATSAATSAAVSQQTHMPTGPQKDNRLCDQTDARQVSDAAPPQTCAAPSAASSAALRRATLAVAPAAPPQQTCAALPAASTGGATPAAAYAAPPQQTCAALPAASTGGATPAAAYAAPNGRGAQTQLSQPEPPAVAPLYWKCPNPLCNGQMVKGDRHRKCGTGRPTLP